MIKNQIRLFGEVLFDQFPDGQQVLGGAPFNVAWHLQVFGLAPDFISRIGNDNQGLFIKQAMQRWGMRLENLQVDPHYSSGKVQITLDNTEPHYEILANQAYDFIDVAHIAGISTPQDVLYHGSLALRHPVSANSFNALLAGHSGRVFVDVNLRYPWWQVEHIKQLLNRADWAKLNEAELCCLSPVQHSLRQRMQLFRHTHNLNVLIVTRGEQGAIALNSQDEFFDVAPEQAVTVVDTVGAGDAFAAVLILGLQYDWPLALTLQRAQAFASAIVGQQGATVHDLCFYQTYSQAWQLD